MSIFYLIHNTPSFKQFNIKNNTLYIILNIFVTKIPNINYEYIYKNCINIYSFNEIVLKINYINVYNKYTLIYILLIKGK